MSAYEFSVAFECADEAAADDVVEAVLLAVCGGQRWKHRVPFRWLARWLPIDVCPRSFVGGGPYELNDEGEPRYEAGKRYFERPQSPPFLNWSATNASTATNMVTWFTSTTGTADAV